MTRGQVDTLFWFGLIGLGVYGAWWGMRAWSRRQERLANRVRARRMAGMN